MACDETGVGLIVCGGEFLTEFHEYKTRWTRPGQLIAERAREMRIALTASARVVAYLRLVQYLLNTCAAESQKIASIAPANAELG